MDSITQNDLCPFICSELTLPSDLNQYITDDLNLSFLNINIRSLSKNYSKLVAFLSQIKHKIKILVITETFLKDHENKLYSIKGYNHVSVSRKSRFRGGLSTSLLL